MMLLGVLIAILVYAGIEIRVLEVVSGDIMRFQESILWKFWDLMRGLFGSVLFLGGLWRGLVAGRKFWQILYVEERYGKPRW